MTGNITSGMNVQEVKDLAAQLKKNAARLHEIAKALDGQVGHTSWHGPTANRFKHDWWPKHRQHLTQFANDLDGLGRSALNNATEQEQTSGSRGGNGSASAVPSGTSGSLAAKRGLTDIMHTDSVSTVTGTTASVLNMAGDVKNLKHLTTAGQGLGYVGNAADGLQIGEDVARGKYVDAGLHTAWVGGDMTADGLKASKTPHGYLGGVAVQTWTEVGREAQNVDWSSKGMQQLNDASLGDWGSSFLDALTGMPVRLIKIFGF